MALIKCPNCKKEISDTTKKCIHCKKRLDGKNDVITPKRIIICLIIILVIALGTISIKQIIKFYNSNSNEHKEVKETSSTDGENKSNDIEEIINIDDNVNDITTNNTEDNKQDTENTKKETSTSDKVNNNKSNNSNNSENTQNSNSKSIISASETKTCNSGYTLSNDKYNCEKTIYINGNTNYICGAGFELVGTKCKSSHTTTPSNGQCYGSYTLENDVCVMYIDATTSTYCPSGYDYANTSDYMENKCSKIEKISPSVEYSCPSGYTLNGTNCEK